MLITSLNLIPAGQLDGGHISYALFGRFHYLISWLVVALLVIAGLLVGSNGGEVWFVWAGMLAVFGLRHPPVSYPYLPLSRSQRLSGAFALLLFVLTFTPVPIQVLSAGAPPNLDRPFNEIFSLVDSR